MTYPYLLTFANGQTVNSADLAYTTLITWERMYDSKITHVNGQPVY
jgi:hypothetical protein